MRDLMLHLFPLPSSESSAWWSRGDGEGLGNGECTGEGEGEGVGEGEGEGGREENGETNPESGECVGAENPTY